MFSPLRVKCLCLPTLVMMKRSPAGAPSRPPSPLPGTRTREPVSTPAGIRTFTCSDFGTVPLPWQTAQGARHLDVGPALRHRTRRLVFFFAAAAEEVGEDVAERRPAAGGAGRGGRA